MPAPNVVECPVCFATLKLKAPPKPGMRLKCPKCAGVFSPTDDAPAPAAEEDDFEAEAPVARPKSRGKATGKKKKSKPVNLMVPLLIGGVLLLLIGLGVGLYLAKDMLFAGTPTVDLAYCQVPNRSMSLEFRVQEFLQSPAVTDAIRKGPQFGESSVAMKELIGAEIGDVDVMQAQMSSPPGGFNPMMGAAQPADALAILKCKKTLTPPASGSFDHQGIKCYRLIESAGTDSIGLKTDTMFFPNPTTVVIGKEATIRQILDNWKSNGPKPAAGIANSGATMFFVAEQSLVSSTMSQITTGNPLMMMGPAAGMADDLKSTGLVLSQHATAFSVSAQLNSGQVAWSAAVHGRDASGAQQIQVALDGLRAKLLALVTTFLQPGLPIPEANKKNFEMAQQALSTPLQAMGDRVAIAVPIPADQQANSIAMLAGIMPPMKSLKINNGTAPTATPTTPPMPVMPTNMPTTTMPTPTPATAP